MELPFLQRNKNARYSVALCAGNRGEYVEVRANDCHDAIEIVCAERSLNYNDIYSVTLIK